MQTSPEPKKTRTVYRENTTPEVVKPPQPKEGEEAPKPKEIKKRALKLKPVPKPGPDAAPVEAPSTEPESAEPAPETATPEAN